MPTDETADPMPEGGGGAPDTPVEPEVPDWDQSLDTFDAQPWAKSIPDKHRDHIKSQFERHNFFRTLVDADDTAAELTKEMDGVRATLGAEVTKYKTEAATHKKAYDDLDTEYKGFRSEVQQERYARKDVEVREKFADIYETYGKATTDEERAASPLAEFVRLTEVVGYPMEKAAKMVRAAFDMPTPGAAPATPAPEAKPRTRDVTPPDSVSLQARDGLNPAESVRKPRPETSEEARRRLQERIEAEEAAEGNA